MRSWRIIWQIDASVSWTIILDNDFYNIIDNFVKRLQQVFELWSSKTRQINQQNRKKIAFQRDLIKTRRDMLIQQNQIQYQSFQQYQDYKQQQQRQYQSQQRQYQSRFEFRNERNAII